MSSKAHPDDGFMMSNPIHSAFPTFVTPWTPGRNFQGFTQGQYYSTSDPVRVSNTTPTDAFVSNDDSWYNPPTHCHSSQHYEPVLGDISAGHSSPFTIGRNYPSSYIFPVPYLNGHAETSSSLFSLSNGSLHQSHNLVPQLNPPSRSFPSIVTPSPPLTVESSQFGILTKVPSSNHGGDICNSIQLSTNQPYPIPISLCRNCHSYLGQCCCKPARSSLNSSSPPLLSCLWLLDGRPCGFTGSLEALKSHCKSSHFFGPQNAQIKCHWEGCNYHKRNDPAVDVMRRDCMWRHTSEVHLGMKRGT